MDAIPELFTSGCPITVGTRMSRMSTETRYKLLGISLRRVHHTRFTTSGVRASNVAKSFLFYQIHVFNLESRIGHIFLNKSKHDEFSCESFKINGTKFKNTPSPSLNESSPNILPCLGLPD